MKPIAGLALLLAASAAHAQAPTLYVRAPAVLDPDAPIAQAVLAECNIEDLVASNAVAGIRRSYRGATQVVRGDDMGRELRLTMLDVTGVGPGPYTRKAITIRADLVQDGQVLVSGVFDRETGGRMIGPALRSACTTLGKIAVLLGKQIGQWANSAVAGLPTGPSVVRVAEEDDPPSAASPNAARTADLRAVERLEALQKLLDEGMISSAEYQQKRAEILKGL